MLQVLVLVLGLDKLETESSRDLAMEPSLVLVHDTGSALVFFEQHRQHSSLSLNTSYVLQHQTWQSWLLIKLIGLLPDIVLQRISDPR